MSERESVQVAARDLDIGDRIDGRTVVKVNKVNSPGVVYAWVAALEPSRERGADYILNHGDPVKVTRG